MRIVKGRGESRGLGLRLPVMPTEDVEKSTNLKSEMTIIDKGAGGRCLSLVNDMGLD